jgi:RHS repeat-associated protein
VVAHSRHWRLEATSGTLRAPSGGFLATSTSWSGPITGSVEHVYDNDFRVNRMTVNGADPVNYQFDADGLVIRAGALVISRDAGNGFISGTTLGQVTTTQSFNRFGELAELEDRIGAHPVFSVQYERDSIGRITSKTETVDGTVGTYAYFYDLAGHLAEVSKNGTAVSRFEYDANGNRIVQESPSGRVTVVNDAQDRVLTHGDMTFTYTENGELASKTQNGQTLTYSYDELGNLRELALPDGILIEYVIDGLNRRIGKRVNGVLVQGFLYEDQFKPIAELNAAGMVVARFTYSTRSNVPDFMVKDGVTYRILSDHLGSPRLVVDTTTGTIAQRMVYDEAGQVILDTNPGFQPFGFTGGLYDRHSGLVRFGARDYDPHTGRWTTKDPARFAGLDANLYSYASGDPVNFMDSAGLMKLPADPTGLPKDWVYDPTHKNPNGERYRHPNGDVLDFDKRQPGKPGWRGRDHWHHRPGGEGGDDHLSPDDEIPDPLTPEEVCRVDVPMSPIPYYVGAGIGAAIIVGTLIEDVLTGGLGTLDDPATLSLGAGLIFGTAAVAGTGSGE